MMRALGFQKGHVLKFVVVQAFSFAIPGMILGLIIAFVINEGFREVMFIALKNAGDYSIPGRVIIITILLFGFIVPIVSIIGPTQEALGKNLRESLDATRRNGDGEGISATTQRLQDLALSGKEILFGSFLVFFGLLTYYILPATLIHEQLGIFIFIMIMIMWMLTVGVTFFAVFIVIYI